MVNSRNITDVKECIQNQDMHEKSFSNKPNLPALADSGSVKIREENYEIFRKNIR